MYSFSCVFFIFFLRSTKLQFRKFENYFKQFYHAVIIILKSFKKILTSECTIVLLSSVKRFL